MSTKLGKKHHSPARDPLFSDTDNESDHPSSELSFSEDGADYDSESEDESDLFVWDVLNPFAPPDPSQAHLESLIQAEIAQMRRYEMIGPLDPLPDQIQPLYDWDESESDAEGDQDEVYDDDDDGDSENDDGDDGDDEDSENDEDEDSDVVDPHKPNVIVLPRLLHSLPLCFITSPHPNHAPSPSLPPPSRLPSASSDTDTSSDESDPPALWADLAQTYNDIAEAEERAARKAKRDAHRSRLKALAL